MENAACNLGAIGLLVNKAGHPATFDTEALTFLRHAHKLCDKAGLSFSDTIAIKRDSHQYAMLSTMPKKAYLDNLADLELLVAKRDAEITRLRAACAEKDARITGLEAIASDKPRVAKLEEACASQANQIEELKSATQERLRETETQRDQARRHEKFDVVNEKIVVNKTAVVQPVNDTESARTEDGVETEVVADKADAAPLKDASSGAAPAAELVWTDSVKTKLVDYATMGVSAGTIGRRLTREFGGRVTSSTVKTMLRSLLTADADGFLWAPHWR